MAAVEGDLAIVPADMATHLEDALQALETSSPAAVQALETSPSAAICSLIVATTINGTPFSLKIIM